jgi:hypothetical protein
VNAIRCGDPTRTKSYLLCREGAEEFNAPTAIRHLGPWTGSKQGEIERLRLPYRLMLSEQAFAVLYTCVEARAMGANSPTLNACNAVAQATCQCMAVCWVRATARE